MAPESSYGLPERPQANPPAFCQDGGPLRSRLAANGAAQYQAHMDRNRQLLDEILATLDDPEAVAAIEAAWDEIELEQEVA